VLKGARIGVLRFATSGSEAVGPLFEASLETLRQAGVILVEIDKGPERSAIGENEYLVLKSEFRAGLDRYLVAAPPAVATRSLADVAEANRRHPTALSLFGQDILLASLDAPAPGSEAHKAARQAAFEATDGWLHQTLKAQALDALVAPTTPQAWKIDQVNGDTAPRFPGVSTIAAVAGTPHLTVPMGVARGLPAGISFLGARWADAKILALGAAFEAARGPLPPAPLVATLER
jgi:amidase